VKTNKIDKNHKLRIDKFNSSDGLEYFISYVSDDERDLYGFCRLRISNDDTEKIEEIHKCALIRELHVYSTLTPVNNTRDKYLEEDSIQHKGFGKRLLKRAEEIASYHNYKKIAVISGVGVREYYRKQGYVLETTYMKKEMSYISRLTNVLMCLIVKMSIMIRKIF
jgi:elongator complex protein 3